MLGSNVPAIGGLARAFEVADRWGCECIQVYVTLSRRWEIRDWTEEEVEAISAAWQRSGVRQVVAHVPYLVNLASPDHTLRRKSTRRLALELARAAELGIRDLVLHPGSCGSSAPGVAMRRIVEGLNTVLDEVPNKSARILLETMAGQGSTIGSRWEELAEILEGVEEKARVGVCVDTCHVFAAGYKLRGYEGYERTMGQLVALFGMERIGAIHVNDSRGDCGSRVDRHAGIGEGKIGLGVFHALVRDVRFLNTPKILEIPQRDEKSEANLKLLHALGGINDLITDDRPMDGR